MTENKHFERIDYVENQLKKDEYETCKFTNCNFHQSDLLTITFRECVFDGCNFSSNTIANELAGNGLYELFAAYRNNELNYTQFYPYLPQQEANQKLASLMVPELATNNKELSLRREVVNANPENKMNGMASV